MIFKSDASQTDLNGFLDRGSLLEGQLRFESQFRVDGRIQGSVSSKGRLIIGEHGEVDAEIEVSEVVISGTVRGTIKADKKVHLAAGGKVFGDLFTPALVIDDGAIFEGKCSMTRPDKTQEPPKRPAKQEG